MEDLWTVKHKITHGGNFDVFRYEFILMYLCLALFQKGFKMSKNNSV